MTATSDTPGPAAAGVRPSAGKAGLLAEGIGALTAVVVTLPAIAAAGVLLHPSGAGDFAGVVGAVLAVVFGVAVGVLASIGGVWWAVRNYCRRSARPSPGTDATIGAAAYAAWILTVGWWTESTLRLIEVTAAVERAWTTPTLDRRTRTAVAARSLEML